MINKLTDNAIRAAEDAKRHQYRYSGIMDGFMVLIVSLLSTGAFQYPPTKNSIICVEYPLVSTQSI